MMLDVRRVRRKVGWGCTVGLWVAACVQDPKVEDEYPPAVGAVQPESTSSATITAQEACDALIEAQAEARDRLSCGEPDVEPACPDVLRVGGALPCDDVREDTVQACVDIIGEYTSCSELDARPCIVTIDPGSCRSPEPPPPPPVDGGDGGGMGGADAGGAAPDSGAGAGGGSADAGESDASGDAGGGGPALEAGPGPDGSSDAASDATTD